MAAVEVVHLLHHVARRERNHSSNLGVDCPQDNDMQTSMKHKDILSYNASTTVCLGSQATQSSHVLAKQES